MTTEWAILYLAAYPDMQDRMRCELNQAFPLGQLPSFGQRSNKTPYTEAFLLEVQRVIDLAPLAIPHWAHQDCQVGQYFIPRGTAVLPHLSKCRAKPEFFPNPEEFR